MAEPARRARAISAVVSRLSRTINPLTRMAGAPWTSRFLHRLGEIMGHSSAGIVAAMLVLAWALVGLGFGFPSWWQITLTAPPAPSRS
jgi:hypothetical protein